LTDISEGIKLFNNCQFFEAHDFFEELWKVADSKDRKFFQAMVQVSVGAYHLVNRNYRGSISQFNKAEKKFLNYKPVYFEVDIDDILMKISAILQILENNEKEFEKITNINLPVIAYFNK
jgi:uncharacterized protein